MKPRVLMIAYACNPDGAGEHWLGWGWAEQAARDFAVDLITTPKARDNVEERAREAGILPHFVEAPGWLRTLTETVGGSWLRKLAWQQRVARLAETLHREKPFALVHQTTFHTFRVPFLATRLAIPSVWGPIAGGERVPPGFERYLGPAKFAERSRNLANRLCLSYPRVRRSLQRASALFVSNRTTLNFLPRECHAKSQVVPPNAMRDEDEQCPPPTQNSVKGAKPFQLLYVGNCVATRGIPIAFEALRQSRLEDFDFAIVGDGPALEHWRQRATELGLADRVKFAGRVPYPQLQGYYAAADALVFPALRDSGGSALLEAMARYVPVICLDWGGPGEMVNADSGIKVPVTNPRETVEQFAAGLLRLHSNPGLRFTLAQAARKRAEALFRWETKRELLSKCYLHLIQGT